MSVIPSDFLSLADFSQESTEIQKRNAISRSYYAAYHVAEMVRILDRLSLPDISGGIHKKLCYALQQSDNEELKIAGYDLNRQRIARAKADYNLAETIGFRVAERETKKNINLFDRLTRYLESLKEQGRSAG